MFDYSIDVQDEQKVVLITLLGDVEKMNLLNVISKQRSIAQAKSYNRLYDFRKSTVSITTTDLFYLPRNEDNAETVRSKTVNIALLIGPGNNRNDFDFHKIATRNTGRNVKVFSSETIAYKWFEND